MTAEFDLRLTSAASRLGCVSTLLEGGHTLRELAADVDSLRPPLPAERSPPWHAGCGQLRRPSDWAWRSRPAQLRLFPKEKAFPENREAGAFASVPHERPLAEHSCARRALQCAFAVLPAAPAAVIWRRSPPAWRAAGPGCGTPRGPSPRCCRAPTPVQKG
jgi:hypothetical protein